ncbi:MAG: ATP-binding cassette domain-containing protein [Alphaproteobacteria bacterium]|nr:ATP-binding cassette domain-containing protein [Alphaproteobacteria bacterium]
MIAIEKLTRRYGDLVAVRDVSTTIQRGEIVGLLGHNGAGKTTVMKILTGFLDATDGTVTVDGLDVATDRTEVQRRIGYLPENAPLYEEMLVQEYLLMMAELRGVPAPDLEARVAEAVVATGLGDRLLSPIGTLSKGLRQRVGIAQAIVHRPEVLVLDEPTNGLDPTQIQAIRELIRRLGERSTIILSTHILQEIEAVCDRVLVMIDGSLAADAPLAELRGARSIRLGLAPGATAVASTLAGVPGITSVTAVTGQPDTWLLAFSGDEPPVPAVIAAATTAGWTITRVAPEQRTLEQVFADLQHRHVAGRGGEA